MVASLGVAGAAWAFTTTEGHQFSGKLGIVSFACGTSPPTCTSLASTYSASLNWDTAHTGQTGIGTATKTSDCNSTDGHCVYDVTGAHTYADEGSYHVSFSVTGPTTKTGSTTATVDDAALTNPTPKSGLSTKQTSFNLGTFDDGNPGADGSDFTASIDWGDGTAPSAGSVGGNGLGDFAVTGDHTYTSGGDKTVTVDITDDGGATASFQTTVFAPKTVHVCATGCSFSSVNAAVNDSSTHAGDTVLVEPGTYTEQVDVAKDITVEGQPGAARPVIEWAGDGATTFKGVGSSPLATAVALKHLDIEASGSSSTALELTQATITDSTVAGDTALDVETGIARRDTLRGGAAGVETRLGGIVTDSVLTATAAGGRAAFADSSPGGFFGPGGLGLRNVTAFATGSGSTGLEANYFYGSSGYPGTIDASNVIARGQAEDVRGDIFPLMCPTGATCSSGRVQIGHSNFRTSAGDVSTTAGHDQSAPPLLVHPIVGPGQDFHETCASPTVDAGAADQLTGPTDVDGRPRTLGPAPDIGAYERAKHPPAATTGRASKLSRSAATVHGSVNPRGCVTSYRFVFGRKGHVRRTPSARAGRGTTAVAVSARLTGLKPGATYGYRLVATSPAGRTAGRRRTFTTPKAG